MRNKIAASLHAGSDPESHPLLGRCIRSPLMAETLFEKCLSSATIGSIGEHRIYGEVVVPATAFFEMALAAGSLAHGEGPLVLEDVVIQAPLILYDGLSRCVQTVVAPVDTSDRSTFKIGSFDSAGVDPKASWQLHVEGRILRPVAAPEPAMGAAGGESCRERVDLQYFYDHLRRRGMDFGPAFRGLVQLDRGDSEALGRITLPEVIRPEVGAFRVHPAVLDACLQTFAASRFSVEDLKQGEFVYMPIGLERLAFYKRPPNDLVSHFCLRPTASDHTLTGDATVRDGDGELIARIEGLSLRKVDHAKLQRQDSGVASRFDDWLYVEEWAQTGTLAGAYAGLDPEPLATVAEIQRLCKGRKARLSLWKDSRSTMPCCLQWMRSARAISARRWIGWAGRCMRATLRWGRPSLVRGWALPRATGACSIACWRSWPRTAL